MNTPEPIHLEGDDWNEAVMFNILVVCEDSPCGRHAQGMLDRVTKLLPFEAKAEAVVLSFDSFKLGQSPAVAEGEAPDIVVVSAHGNHRLPQAVKDWLGKWAARAHGLTCALAVVLDVEHHLNPAAVETLAFLQSTAKAAGIDWIEASSAADIPGDQLREELSQKASTVSTTLDEIIRTPRSPISLRGDASH